MGEGKIPDLRDCGRGSIELHRIELNTKYSGKAASMPMKMKMKMKNRFRKSCGSRGTEVDGGGEGGGRGAGGGPANLRYVRGVNAYLTRTAK